MKKVLAFEEAVIRLKTEMCMKAFKALQLHRLRSKLNRKAVT
jgi:hypothetical protein